MFPSTPFFCLFCSVFLYFISFLKKAEDYPKLNQVIFLGILDFTMFEQTDKYITKHLIRGEDTNLCYFEDLMFYFVELPKFNLALKDLHDLQDKWIYFLKHAGSLEVIPEELREEPIESAFEIALMSNMSKEEYEVYQIKKINK